VTFDAGDITIAVLTGRRPHLLKRTLDALPDWLWTSAHTVVMHNSGDDKTAEVLNDYKIDLRYTCLDGLWPIGSASSHLFKLAQAEQRSFTLHLQDDWLCHDQSDEWLLTALRILDGRPEVKQVRLRLTSERVSINHLVDGQQIRWNSADGYRWSRRAHYTLNPTLMRTEDLLTDIEGERDGMRQFLERGWHVAQLTPGVFAHIGGHGQSLRQRAELEEVKRRHGRA
jgi:hypothetical protein